MSRDSAKQFLEKARQDEALHQKLNAIDSNPAAAVKLGAQAGFVFDEDELLAASDELYGDLSDDDLAAAAGGQGGKLPPIIF